MFIYLKNFVFKNKIINITFFLKVYLITRRGTWIFRRNYYNSEPFDLILNRRLIYFFFKYLPIQITNGFLTWELSKQINHKKYGIMPKHGIFAYIIINFFKN